MGLGSASPPFFALFPGQDVSVKPAEPSAFDSQSRIGAVGKIASESSISSLFCRSMEPGKTDMFRSAYLRHCFVEMTSGKGQGRLYVDLGSIRVNVSSPGCGSDEFGKPKVDEVLPQINMAYCYDRSSGVTVFYDSFREPVTDISYCTKGISLFLDNLNVSSKNVRYDFILDRGYFSELNMELLADAGISFVAMRTKTSVLSGLLKENRERSGAPAT